MAVTSRKLDFSKRAFYMWCAHPVSDRDWEEAHLLNAAYDIHADDPEFGHRIIDDEHHAAGYQASERRGWGPCSRQRLFSTTVKKARKNGKKPARLSVTIGGERDFTADSVNESWLTDIAEHRTREGTLYMCAVKDVYSNRIVGYALDPRMQSRLAAAAINDAVARRGGPCAVAGCLVHSDRGNQFRSRRSQLALKRHGLVASMGRAGAAGNNGAMESFFATLQNNVLNRGRWDTRDELRRAIIHWIERTYHRRRRQRRLSKLTSVEYDSVDNDAVALAA